MMLSIEKGHAEEPVQAQLGWVMQIPSSARFHVKGGQE